MVVPVGADSRTVLDQCGATGRSILFGLSSGYKFGPLSAKSCADFSHSNLALPWKAGLSQQGISIFLLCILSVSYADFRADRRIFISYALVKNIKAQKCNPLRVIHPRSTLFSLDLLRRCFFKQSIVGNFKMNIL